MGPPEGSTPFLSQRRTCLWSMPMAWAKAVQARPLASFSLVSLSGKSSGRTPVYRGRTRPLTVMRRQRPSKRGSGEWFDWTLDFSATSFTSMRVAGNQRFAAAAREFEQFRPPA